jgi:hypothetical protein
MKTAYIKLALAIATGAVYLWSAILIYSVGLLP